MRNYARARLATISRSKLINHSLRLSVLPRPGPCSELGRFTRTTRWQGTMIEKGHRAMTAPTALPERGLPARSPISP